MDGAIHMKAQNNTYDMNRVRLRECVPLDTPFQFCIEPTFLCNFRCNYCMHAASKDELEKHGFSFSSMSWDMFELILNQLTEFPRKIKKVTFSGFGEPLLDKRLPEMIRRIKEEDITEKILVISNGVLLTSELWTELVSAGLSEIKISIQGMSADKYKKICEATINFEEFLKMLTYAYKHRGNCIVRIKIADAALDVGEDKLFYEKFGSICDYIAIEHIYEQFKFVDYEGKLESGYKNNRFGYDFKPINVCSALFFKMNVLQDGRITFGYPDGVTFEGFSVGKKSLYDVWNSPERYVFLTDNLTGNYDNRKDCRSCTRWAYSVVPEDLLDGHEAEILTRMPPIDTRKYLRKPIVLCGNVNC